MSHIPNKAMHHAHAAPDEDAATGGTGGGELGAVPDRIANTAALGWIASAVGAGALVVAAAALLSLRSSKPKPKAAGKRRGPAKLTGRPRKKAV